MANITNNKNLDDLRQMIYDLLNDLECVFTRPHERGDLGAILFFYKRLHPDRIKPYANEKLIPHKDQIKKRDLTFFDNNRYIFAGLGDDKVKYYRDEIIERKRISDEDMKMIWNYLDSMIALVDAINDTK